MRRVRRRPLNSRPRPPQLHPVGVDQGRFKLFHDLCRLNGMRSGADLTIHGLPWPFQLSEAGLGHLLVVMLLRAVGLYAWSAATIEAMFMKRGRAPATSNRFRKSISPDTREW